MSAKENESNSSKSLDIALFNLGFRPFFLGAGLFSVVSTSLWGGIFLFQLPVPIESISIFQWHAHEMIYGYALAVIAGFLLTAVKNWTGIQTLNGRSLSLLFLFWGLSRVLFLFGTEYLFIAGILDILFALFLNAAVSYPIIKVKQWKQLAILSKLILIAVGNVFFYSGALGYVENGVYWGIYGGLYLIISLILMMGRRVIPFFIEGGVDYQVRLYNSKWLDMSSLLFFLIFFVSELFLRNQVISAYAGLGLFVINSTRLAGWYTRGIWKNPLLWSLYLSFWFICIGFLMFACVHFFGVSKFIAVHFLAFGGIGIITMGMMARVALGHTARNIRKPPRAIGYALFFLLLGALVRVGLPLIDTSYYLFWIGLSTMFWVVSFSIFAVTYFPILVKPRVDGKFG